MTDKIVISKKELKGEDGHKTFSVRLRDDLVEKLNELAAQSNRSRNEVVNILLEYGIENCEITA